MVLALLILAQMTWAATVTKPADIPAYYANANGKSGTSLYTTLNTITNKGYHDLGYDGAIDAYQKSDVYPTDPNHPDYVKDKAGKLWDMYGACSFEKGNECGNYDSECDCYNREHSVPKSWWGGGKNDMYSDIFHLVPTDGYVNNRRSNYAFGEVQTPTYTYNACKLGSPKSVSTDKETLLGKSASISVEKVFEPRDEYKGDFARGYLGMIAKYSNEKDYAITSGAGGKIFEAFSSTTHFGLTQYGIVLLMKWHREDPVSRKEIDRNNGIQATQGNRNPFIDYPYLAEYIWGEKNGQTVDMSKLMPSTDPDFIPGVSNGWRGEDTPPTPPTPTVQYGVTWSVCGETHTDSIAENAMVILPSETPASCSAESPVFMGWTDAPISGVLEDEPAVLYRQSSQFPVVTEDVTYYAVFAHETIVEGATVPTDVTFDFNDMGLKDKGVISTPFEKEDVTITFDKGGAGTAPTYYTGAVRLYAQGTMTVTANAITQIDFTFGAGDKSNPITANVDTFESPTWTGEADEVVFTVGDTNGHRKFASLKVSMNGSGTSISYDRFITSYQGTTEVEMLSVDAPARKILVGGKIYILCGRGGIRTPGTVTRTTV